MLREATAYVALSRLSLPRRRGSPISPLCEGAERAGPILGRVVSKRNRVQGFRSRRKEEHTEMSAASAHPVRVEGRPDREALGAAAPDGPVLAARVGDEGVKAALLAEDAAVYFTTPHFDGYPAIL